MCLLFVTDVLDGLDVWCIHDGVVSLVVGEGQFTAAVDRSSMRSRSSVSTVIVSPDRNNSSTVIPCDFSSTFLNQCWTGEDYRPVETDELVLPVRGEKIDLCPAVFGHPTRGISMVR